MKQIKKLVSTIFFTSIVLISGGCDTSLPFRALAGDPSDCQSIEERMPPAQSSHYLRLRDVPEPMRRTAPEVAGGEHIPNPMADHTGACCFTLPGAADVGDKEQYCTSWSPQPSFPFG